MEVLYTSKAGRTATYTVTEEAWKCGVSYYHLESLDKSFNFWVPKGACKTKQEVELFADVIKPTPTIAYNARRKIKLYDHQHDGIQHLLRTPRAYLGDEMGLGKTIQAIIAADNTPCEYVLVVCPASLQKNWEKEIGMFSFFPEKFYVYSYGKVPETISGKAILICDEAHYIKNWTSQRTKRVTTLATKADRVWLLSGTMLTKSAIDAYVPLTVLHGQLPNKKGYYAFAHQFCDVRQTKFGYEVQGTRNEDALKKELAKFYLGRKKNEVLNLPEKILTTIPVSIDMKIAKESAHLYELYEEGKLTIEESGAFATTRKAVGIGKIKQALAFIKEQFEDSGESVVIFAYHKDVVAAIHEALPESRTITGDTPLSIRQTNVEDFQAGKFQYLIGNILACGTGFTLTKASHAVFVEVDITPANNLQAEDRIHRIGQTGTCNIYYLCAEESLDERIFEIIKRKEKDIKKVI